MSTKKSSSVILIGAGGHANVLLDILELLHIRVSAYVDPLANPWLDKQGISHISEETFAKELCCKPQLVMGFVGLKNETLQRRLKLMRDYVAQGAQFPSIVHPHATVSRSATISAGAQIMPGVVVNAGAYIGEGTVINSNATVEHDAVIGDGTHAAPGSIVLGAANVGECAFIGSGSVIVQNVAVPANSFIKAQTVYKK